MTKTNDLRVYLRYAKKRGWIKKSPAAKLQEQNYCIQCLRIDTYTPVEDEGDMCPECDADMKRFMRGL